jgi:hypothetical protein
VRYGARRRIAPPGSGARPRPAPQPQPHERDPARLGDQPARELERLAHDDVGAPCVGQREQVRQRAPAGHAGEAVAQHQRVGLPDRQGGRAVEDRPPALGRRVGERRGGDARALDGREPRPLGGHEHVVAGARRGVREGQQREQVAGVPGGREEDPHVRVTRCGEGAFPVARTLRPSRARRRP